MGSGSGDLPRYLSPALGEMLLLCLSGVLSSRCRRCFELSRERGWFAGPTSEPVNPDRRLAADEGGREGIPGRAGWGPNGMGGACPAWGSAAC